jgi:hypothetical protein
MECWAIHVETCQNRVTTGYNRLAAITGGTRLIHKLPLLFELPSYKYNFGSMCNYPCISNKQSNPDLLVYLIIYLLIFSEEIDIVEPKPTTVTEKLRKDLLYSYSPYLIPVLHEEHHVAVFMRLTFHHVDLVS